MSDDAFAARTRQTPLDGATSGTGRLHALPQIPDHELIRPIGRGSYGEVWLARSVMGTYRAVKIIYRHTFKEAHPFEREYNGIRKFEPISRSHEGLMDILQIGRNDQDGYFYYVMELADDANAECGARNAESALTRPSDTLSHPMGEGRGEGIGSLYAPKTIHSEISRRGRLPFEECLQLSLSLTAALDHLHKGGLVHRDIKPSNIIFVNGVPKLADIGLVADTDDAKSFVGTEGFIPPEGPGTPQADIYSLGKVLYEIATGKDRQSFPEPPTLVADFPERERFLELNEVIIRACETNLRTRYHTAEEIHSDLVFLLSGKSVKHLRAMERRLAIMTRIGVVTVAVIVLAAFPYFMAIKEARHAKREAGRARLAEADAKEKLWGAYLAQAQAGRWSHRPGRRFDGLELIKKAAEIRPSLELRNEAIACMALSDLRLVTELPAIPETDGLGDCLDRKYERYAYADALGTVHICRVQDGAELMQFPGYESRFYALRFSPDGRLLLVACGKLGERVEIVDLSSKQVLLSLSEPLYRTADFSADSRLVAISYDRAQTSVQTNWPVRIFDLALREEVASFNHGSLPSFLGFHPKQSNLLLSSDGSPIVRIWDWKTGGVVQNLAHPNWVQGIDWHPSGDIVATACADGNVRLWDAASGQERAVLAGHDWAAVGVSFSHDGAFLASCGWDGTLRVWDPAAKRELVTKQASLVNRFSSTGNKLAIKAGPGRFAFLDVASGHGYRLLRSALAEGERSVACDFSPDGRMLVSTHQRGMRLWDVAAGREIAKVTGEFWYRFAKFHPDGTNLFLGNRDGVENWLLEERSPSNHFALGLRRRFDLVAETTVILLSRDGRTLAGTAHGGLEVLDTTTGRKTARLKPSYGWVFGALNADGQLAATWTRSSTNVQIWDVARSNLVHEVPAHLSIHVTFSPNNEWLILGDSVEFRAWNLHTWESLYAVPREYTGYYGYMGFSSDSRVLAVAISRSTVRLVEAATGRELATLEGPDRLDIDWITFNADGTQLAVVGGSGPIQLWDLRLIRQQLAAMKLDWELPPLATGGTIDHAQPMTLTVLAGEDGPRRKLEDEAIPP